MYHPINRINCPPLNKLNDLARLTLEFCLTKTLQLSEQQIQVSFIQHFTINGFPKAGDWLWKKDVLVRPYVLNLIILPIIEKQEIFTVYLQNLDFDARFADGQFIDISMPPVSQNAYEYAAVLAYNFYEILCDGVSGEIIGEQEKLNRQTVLRAYLDAQQLLPKPLKVCPGCDGQAPSVSDEVVNEDIDHFFPKSKYPFLSIHPLNLTPYCKYCNQTYKRNKDSIYDIVPEVDDVHTLNDIYHPYERPAKNDLAIKISSLPGTSPKYEITCNLSNPPYRARLHSLQYTLKIDSRWTGDLSQKRIEPILESLLLFGVQSIKVNNFQPTLDWLDEQLETAIDTLNRQQGKQVLFVPALAYVQWVASDPDQKKLWLKRVQDSLFPIS